MSFIPKELVGRDIYQILGLSFEDAGKDDIKNLIRKRYLKCALILHPDKAEGGKNGSAAQGNATNGSATQGTAAQGGAPNASTTDSFNTLKCAYEFLMNEQLRNKYNQYVTQQRKKKKKNGPVSGNISLSRFLDKNKFEEQQREKLLFKRRLEAREREMAEGKQKKRGTHNGAEWPHSGKSGDPTESSYPNGRNNRKQKKEQQDETLRERNNLKNIKAQNEDFIKRHSAHPDQRNRQKGVREGEDENERDRSIEIYLDNYPHNVHMLQRYMEQKELLTFFVDFNIQRYHLYTNEEQTQSERRVGLFSFTHRSEAIRAYLHFKKNGKHIDRNFKLKLAVPCNEGGEVRSEGVGPQKGGANEAAPRDSVDRMMSEMVDELDKMFSL
ncbi:DnaJ domain-containing protein [Plasmodium vivax India VII]|uniref:DnaJ domain-containing protein n=1 Tax=Plasmodium vivax India VII TaxID=1077284 RepID=A0A0J9UXC2_PLAVI|nr:DnaJ domain-containing protein [Plasmodium vivax India VII]CAI7722915.1 DnaJ protein, putative [Plasmodium vivax]